MSIMYTKSLPVVAEPDVLVCGTGLAGIGAAVGAARNGASVMLERMGVVEPGQARHLSYNVNGDFTIGFVELTFELRRKCAAVLEQARAEGKIGLYGGPWPATFSGRDIYFNVIRTPRNATNPQDWTNAEIQGRRDGHGAGCWHCRCDSKGNRCG